MIKIKRNTNGDSRVAKNVPTFWEFREANVSHKNDVRALMSEFAEKIEAIGDRHDWTKTSEELESTFYREMCNTIEGRMKFEDGKWSKIHYETERHHLHRNVPKDVNLFDVLEMIADCVCAGYARSGYVSPIEIGEDTLTIAVTNTVEWCKEMIEVDEK